MAFILPKENTYLIGHEKAEKMFLEAFDKGTMHHALLISGLKGIGKATFAYKIARFLLQDDFENAPKGKLDISPSSPVFKQICADSNPNFLAIERDYTETDKKKIIKAIKDGEPLDADSMQDLKKSAVIKVDEVRQINAFLSKKSFDGAWRVVLIDSVDEMNASSANALLKILEEPPEKTMLLLISHQPSKLLPTIKSRCVKLALEPLVKENVASLLRRYMPDLIENEVNELSAICDESIGKALNYAANNGLDIYQRLQSVIYARSRFDLNEALALAVQAASDENVWDLILELTLHILSDMITSGENVEALYEVYTLVLRTNSEVIGLNMDKRQALINLFYQISKAV